MAAPPHLPRCDEERNERLRPWSRMTGRRAVYAMVVQ